VRQAVSLAGRRRSRLGGGILLFGIAVTLILVAGAVSLILDRRAHELAAAEKDAASLALALGEQTSRTFQAVDIVLRHVAETVRVEGATSPAALTVFMGTPAVHDMLSTQIVGLGQLDAVSIADSDGRLVNGSRTWPSPPINVADRDYFVALRDTPSLETFISVPVQTRIAGIWTIFVARRLAAPDGSFLGLAVGAIRLDYFEDFYRAVSDAEGRGVTLRRRDGALLARHPRFGNSAATSIGDEQMFRTIREGAVTARSFTASPADGIRRLRVARALKDVPLVLVVSMEASAIDAEWWPEALYIGGGALTAAAALLLAAILLARQIRRREDSETALAATLEHMSQGIMMIDRDGRIPVCNRRTMEMLDLPADLMTANPRLIDVAKHQIAQDEFGPDGSVNHEMVRRLLSIGGVWSVPHTYERQRPDGTTIEILTIPLPGGGAVRTFTDVTYARMREAALRRVVEKNDAAEAALRQHRDDLEREVAARTDELAASEARLREGIETIPEGFVLFDAEDRLVLCNTAYRDIYGFTKATVKPGVSFVALTRDLVERGFYAGGEDTDSLLAARLAQHQATTSVDHHFDQHLSNGRWIEFHERRTGDGGIVGLRIDVTEARRQEAAEREREKLASLGQLAGGVAHEINNLLQPALTFPDLIRDRLPPEDLESREDLELVLDSVRKAREIVRNILLFSRKQEPTLETADLAVETDNALKFIRGLLPPGISLRPNIGLAGVMAAVNKTQLTQVLTNLVVNAAHATGGRGTIEVSLGQARPSTDQAGALGIEAGAVYLTLAVADNGTGMDGSTLSHIFEPFFTTKPLGEGTGLGLSVVFGILRSWKGAIAVDSTVGSGTVFTLYIPMVDQDQPTYGTAEIAA
jgi:signal transduction histidine kinase